MLWFSLMQFFSSAKEYYILSIDPHWLRLQYAIPPRKVHPCNWLTNISRGRGGQEFYNRDCYRGGEFDTTWKGWVLKQLYYFHISYKLNLRGRVIWWTPISFGRAFAHNFRTWEMGGGHVEVQFDRCIMKLLIKNCEWKETGASRFLLFARPVNDARYTGCRNTCVATHSDTAESIFLCHPLKLMHRTKQELFQDVHLLFLDDLECYLLSFWPNERTGSTLFSMPILSWSDFRKTMSLQVFSC